MLASGTAGDGSKEVSQIVNCTLYCNYRNKKVEETKTRTYSTGNSVEANNTDILAGHDKLPNRHVCLAQTLIKLAPLLQEVGVQVDFDFKRGEVFGARSSLTVSQGCNCEISLAPAYSHKTEKFHCRVCDVFGLNNFVAFCLFGRMFVLLLWSP